jgi:hypothetical protein
MPRKATTHSSACQQWYNAVEARSEAERRLEEVNFGGKGSWTSLHTATADLREARTEASRTQDAYRKSMELDC